MWTVLTILIERSRKKILYFKWPYLLMGALTCILLFARWASEDESLRLFKFIDFTGILPYIDREEAFGFLFDDFFAIYWIATTLLFLPRFIFGEILNSFTVSDLLYLKMSPMNTQQMAIYRVTLILFGALLYCIIAFLGAAIYCLVHQTPIRGPMISVLGLLAHILLIGGTMVCFQLSHKADLADRRRWMYFFICFPILLYIFGNRIADKLDGYFPFASPYTFRMEGFKVIKSFGSGILLGGSLLAWHILKATIQVNRYYKNLNKNAYED